MIRAKYQRKQLPPGQPSTLTPSRHNGQRSQPGLPSYQPAPVCPPMTLDVRLWAGFGAASGRVWGWLEGNQPENDKNLGMLKN